VKKLFALRCTIAPLVFRLFFTSPPALFAALQRGGLPRRFPPASRRDPLRRRRHEDALDVPPHRRVAATLPMPSTLRSSANSSSVFLLREPRGRPAGLPLCPGWNGMSWSSPSNVLRLAPILYIVNWKTAPCGAKPQF
jgi:hypothetical protein